MIFFVFDKHKNNIVILLTLGKSKNIDILMILGKSKNIVVLLTLGKSLGWPLIFNLNFGQVTWMAFNL